MCSNSVFSMASFVTTYMVREGELKKGEQGADVYDRKKKPKSSCPMP